MTNTKLKVGEYVQVREDNKKYGAPHYDWVWAKVLTIKSSTGTSAETVGVEHLNGRHRVIRLLDRYNVQAGYQGTWKASA
jgi:hypothetical protein